MESWLILFVILILVEISTVNMVSIWFALGALLTAICSLFIKSMGIQTAIFVISSVIFFIATKPVISKFQKKAIVPTNLDRVIGKIGIVTESITKLEPGEVRVDGKRWTAASTKNIEKGSKVEILSIDGVKLHVKEVKEEE